MREGASRARRALCSHVKREGVRHVCVFYYNNYYYNNNNYYYNNNNNNNYYYYYDYDY